MWLMRVNGGAREVVEGVGETSLGQPFEVDAKTGKARLEDGTGRWAEPTKAQVAAEQKRRAKAADEGPSATGAGSQPAPANPDATPTSQPAGQEG